MIDDKKPTVTVSVITYNSAKYVAETLESIKNQSYPNLILQISDDCSTDNTIDICKSWINKNKDRFVKTKIIVPESNTGVTGNCNRAWDVCETRYFKGIAGDDLLLPYCIEKNMQYVTQHPEAIFVFSKIQVFGADEKRNLIIEKMFDYSCFKMTPEEQLNRLLNGNNFIPASTAFVNIDKVREINLRHDIRIPNLEDLPKWVNALRLKVKFHFMDTQTVKYRIHNNSLSTSNILSPRFHEQLDLFWLYYTFDDLYKKDPDEAIKMAVKRNSYFYKQWYNLATSKRVMLASQIVEWINKLLFWKK